MNDATPKSAVELELKRLEKRLEDLIVTVGQIKEENRARGRKRSRRSGRASCRKTSRCGHASKR